MTKAEALQMQQAWALSRLNGWLEDVFEGNTIVTYSEKTLTQLDTVIMDVAQQIRRCRYVV